MKAVCTAVTLTISSTTEYNSMLVTRLSVPLDSLCPTCPVHPFLGDLPSDLLT